MALSQQELTDLVGQIVTNAQKLGLIWQIRPGTVVGSDADGNSLVLLDGGGLKATPATPIDGLPLDDARVWVISVPPNGDYVIGTAPLEGHARMSGEMGSETLTFASASGATQAVTFTREFASVPTVLTNIMSSSNEVARWHSRAFSITTTGFTLWVSTGDGSSNAWNSRTVQWAAFVNE